MADAYIQSNLHLFIYLFITTEQLRVRGIAQEPDSSSLVDLLIWTHNLSIISSSILVFLYSTDQITEAVHSWELNTT